MPASFLVQMKNGTVKDFGDKRCIFYDGYWIRYYPPPPESLAAKKRLIENLKKRLFHHTESGINTPGRNLIAARESYETEIDPACKRVKGAMLAGALFNRATDIFTTAVELEGKGVKISPDNELMRQSGEYFEEALELGKLVKHYSGHEGVDELWGEPLKAFALPIEDFYTSRYVKIAQTMRDIDIIVAKMVEVLCPNPAFEAVISVIEEYGEIAKLEAETIRSDIAIFDVWPKFVATGEAILTFIPSLPDNVRASDQKHVNVALGLLHDGKNLVSYLAGVRTPMPKSSKEYLERCDLYLTQTAPKHLTG